MGNTLFAIVLGVSILIQIAAAVYAIVNVTHTQKPFPWIFIAVAIVLMAVRRIITLAGMIATWETPRTVSWGAELTALLISILMCTGMILLNRMVRQLSKTMAEQNAMFRESLHTSKNNLQSLASLLRTQADFATESHERALAQELEQKVAAYSILQQQLFENQFSIDPKAYLEELIATIEDAYSTPDRFVPVKREIEDIEATPKETLYLGLIVSEALINAFKYAATPNSVTTIHVRVWRDPPSPDGNEDGADDAKNGVAVTPGRRRVAICDNGGGYAPDVISGERRGFGLTFLQSLNSKTWTVGFENRNGACVTASF